MSNEQAALAPGAADDGSASERPSQPATGPFSREQLGEKVREVATAWSLESADRPGAGIQTWEQLEPELQEMYMRCGEALFGLGMTWSPVPVEQVERFVAASLEFDYTAAGDCGGEYADDAAEREAALGNIVEMHRLLNLRAERLATAHEEINRLKSEVSR